MQLGTDSWRGPLGSEVNATSVAAVTQAFVEAMPVQRVGVAYDGRHQSAEFAAIVAKVLQGNGIEVFLADRVTPTPVLAWMVRSQAWDAGIMVTASHNPASDNGLKFKAAYGGPLERSHTQAIATQVGRTPVRIGELPRDRIDMIQPYCAHLSHILDLAAIRAAALPVIVDVMHGATGTLFSELIPEITTLAGDLCPNFGGRQPEPIRHNLAPLQQALRSQPQWALGLATDGDGDRLGVFLDGGTWLSAQDMILLLSRHVVTTRQVAGSIIKTAAVTDKLRDLGRPVQEVPVGFQAICSAMRAEQAAIGCEESGGYGCGLHLPERDGLFTGLLLLEMLARSGARYLSECVTQPIAYDRRDFRLPQLPDLQALQDVSTFAGSPIREIKTYTHPRGHLNGVKYYLADAWVMWRCSETEPLARVYVEADDTDLMQHYLDSAEARLCCSLSTAS